MPATTFDAIPTVNTCAIACKMIEWKRSKQRMVKKQTAATSSLTCTQTVRNTLMNRITCMEFAQGQAHDPGCDAMMTATVYRVQRNFCNEHLPANIERKKPFTFTELQWLQHNS